MPVSIAEIFDIYPFLLGLQDLLCNSERFIVFQTVILQRARHVTTSPTIRGWIEKRIDAWEDGKNRMIVGDTLLTCAKYLTVAQREESAEHQSPTY